MTVIAVRKDPQRLTLTIEAEFDTSVERIWRLWADPRQLERWWGPPTYPATFTKHDLAPGSRVEFHMTGPAGDQPHGYWDILEVEPPRRILFRDACANVDGTPNTDMPTSMIRVDIGEVAQGAPACRSRSSSPAPRPWSRPWPGARTRDWARPSARSMPSSPKNPSNARSRGDPL
jgi:uncharacterized protein YndB with AHSA1/START domain